MTLCRLLTTAIFLLHLSFAVYAQNEKTLASFEQKIEAGKLTEVERDLFSFVVANPANANGFALLAKLRLKQNRLSEAKSLTNKSLMLNPNLQTAKLTLASIYFQTGERESLRAVLDGISNMPDISSQLVLAELYAAIEDCPQSLSVLAKLPLKIKNSEALPIFAKCYLAAKDEKNFNAVFAVAKIATKQNSILAAKLAEVLNKAGRYRETVELLRPVIVATPNNVNNLFLLAKAQIYLKDFAGAKTIIKQAEKVKTDAPELLFVKAIFESEQENAKEAVALLEQALISSLNNKEYLSSFVIFAIRASENRKALQAAEILISLEPRNADFLYLYGISNLQTNNAPKAEVALAQYFEMKPQEGRGCIALGLAFAAQPEKLGIARNQILKCLEINPNDSEAAYQLGLSYKASGETAKAIEFFEKTVKLAPANSNALRDLGAVYLQNSAETKARAVLEKAVSINPNDGEAHFQLSRLYNLLGERELAKKHLEIFQKLKNLKKGGM